MPDKAFLKQKITTVDKLPTLPTIVTKILKLIDRVRGTDVSTLSEIIKNDPALTARILRVANSPFYGYRGEVSTVSRAIIVIGFNEMKSILLSTSIVNIFKRGPNHFNYYKFWQYSVTSAVISRLIARIYRYNISGDAFVSALLHEIGILIIDQYFPREFEEIVKNVSLGKTLKESELLVLGVDHKEIGVWLVEKWNLPGQFSDVMQYYDKPESADKNKALCSIVHLSCYLAKKMKAGATIDMKPIISKGVWQVFEDENIDITASDEKALIERVSGEIEKYNEFINLITTN